MGATLAMTAAAPSSATSAIRLELSPRTDAQSVTLRSTEPECCYSGRRFGGKSWIGCAKALLYAAKYPGARVALCREERASMESTTLLTLRSEIVPAEVWASYWREGKSTLYLPNGSEINAFGLDKPGRALGARYGLAVIDQAEQLDYNQFTILNSCVMQTDMPFHQTLLLFNPDSPEHWAYKRYQPDLGDGVRTKDGWKKPFARVVHVLPDDLMDLLSETSRARLNDMDGVWKLRYRLGQWAAFEGSVYGDLWATSLHVVSADTDPVVAAWSEWGGYPPPTWPRWRAIDFGMRNPFVCQWWAESPDGVSYRYREIYHSGRLTEDHGRQIVQLESDELSALQDAAIRSGCGGELEPYLSGLYVTGGFSDPAAPELRETLARAGVHTSPANNDVLAGIESVRAALKNGVGGPRIKFVRGALVEQDRVLLDAKLPTCTEEELPGYTWQKDRTTGAEQGPRDLPIKRNDHGCDAARYYVHTRSLAPCPQVYG